MQGIVLNDIDRWRNGGVIVGFADEIALAVEYLDQHHIAYEIRSRHRPFNETVERAREAGRVMLVPFFPDDEEPSGYLREGKAFFDKMREDPLPDLNPSTNLWFISKRPLTPKAELRILPVAILAGFEYIVHSGLVDILPHLDL